MSALLSLFDILLVRTVTHNGGFCPMEGRIIADEVLQGSATGDPDSIICAPVLERYFRLCRPLLRQAEGCRRHCKLAVPVAIEGFREFCRDHTRGEGVVVCELGVRLDLKILGANVPAADQRHGIVDDHQLVVHPIIKPALVDQEVETAQECVVTSIIERIEDADLDIRLSSQRQYFLIARYRVTVVDQNSNTHSAAGSALKRVADKESGFVAAKDEVLHVNGFLRGIYHLNPGDEPIYSRVDDVVAGFVLVALGRGEEFPPESRVLRPVQRE